MEELQRLVAQLEQVKEHNFGLVLSVFAAAYLYKQTFAIPGSVFLVSSAHSTVLVEMCAII